MASRLSFWRMHCTWQRLFRRATALLALLLASSLAHAGAACGPSSDTELPGVRAAAEERCLTAGAMEEACISKPQRMDVLAAASASPNEIPPAGCAVKQRRGIFRSAASPLPPVGLAPASPTVPAYILLRRYLS